MFRQGSKLLDLRRSRSGDDVDGDIDRSRRALEPVPLRTLDALHLALAMASGADEIATADEVMARAAEQLQLAVHFFGAVN